jgi:hypothetical protein
MGIFCLSSERDCSAAMNSRRTSDPMPPERYRFGLGSLFRLQLVLAPLFLIPLYLRVHEQHPYVIGLALLVAPAMYVSALLLWSPSPRGSASRVFAMTRGGAMWGIVFGILSMLPATVIEWAPRFAQWKTQVLVLSNVIYYANVRVQVWEHPGEFLLHVSGLFLGLPLLLLFILLHYALIGAAVGGVIGLVKNRRCSLAATSEPSTQYGVPGTDCNS